MADAEKLARNLLKAVNRAVREFGLIEDGDRIAVGVSGGKDSRTLLDLLEHGVDIPGTYEVVAVHVDGAEVGLPELAPTLEPWFHELGVEYAIVPLDVPDDEPLPMDCFRCSWNRRKALFFAADRMGCNKVAFGHHADDAAVTTLMSLMYKGKLETLEPSLDFFDGRFIAIRPLIYLPERDIVRYAKARGWTFPTEPRVRAGTTLGVSISSTSSRRLATRSASSFAPICGGQRRKTRQRQNVTLDRRYEARLRKLSRFLSLLLRHRPARFPIPLDDQGYADLTVHAAHSQRLAQLPLGDARRRRSGHWPARTTTLRDRGGEDGVSRIRALYGHTAIRPTYDACDTAGRALSRHCAGEPRCY